MKKTKIIIPALALLTLSAAASVSGTVAWFSASRSADVAVSNIAVINPEGNLSCSTTAVANTKVDNGNVSLEDNFTIRDASVQMAKGTTEPTVWRAKNVSATGTSSSFETVAKPYVYNTSKSIAYCAAWKMTFKIDGNSTDIYNVTFNVGSSSIAGIPKGEEAIYSAFRIGLYSKDAMAVWAPKEGGTTLSYVNSSTGTDNYTKASGSINFGSIAATQSGSTTTPTSLDVYAYLWFEGTSEACVKENLSAGKTVSASVGLNFTA